MSGNSPEEIRRETRVYIIVFVCLAVLTIATVLATRIETDNHGVAVLIALSIASVKGFLVAGFFMHLLSEKKLIYGVIGLTVFFFLMLLWGPWHHFYDAMGR